MTTIRLSRHAGFGQISRSMVSSNDNRYKFTGKERDLNETNWDYFGARYYDSRIGRWLQVDPLESKFPALSPFIYSLNNPIRFIDMYGLEASDFYDQDGNHKYINDNDQNAYLVSDTKVNEITKDNAEEVKEDNSTVNLGDNKDVTALAKVVYNEARGESTPTQIAIATTVLNRSEISGKSIKSEADKPAQYTGISRLASLTLENVSNKDRKELVNSFNSAFQAIIMKNNGENPIGNNVTHFFSPSKNYPYPKWGEISKEVKLPAPYNKGNFIYWKNIAPYQRKEQ